MTRRSVAWIVVSVLAVVTIAGAALFALASMVFDDHEGEPVALDEKQATKRLQLVHMTPPAGFRFGQMTTYQQFVGAPAFVGRYDWPANPDGTVTIDLDARQTDIHAANPTFPPFRAASCDDESVRDAGSGTVGFSCSATMQMRVSSRTPAGLDPADYAGIPPDTETMALTSDGRHLHLFVYGSGH